MLRFAPLLSMMYPLAALLLTAISVIPVSDATAAGARAPSKPPERTVETAPAPASDEQRAAAQLPYYGDYACEFGQQLSVSRARYDSYVDVRFGKQVFTMKPVLSDTGAVRMEDVKGEVLLLQIPAKSMLMSVRQGRRLVDECVHEQQRLARKASLTQPPSEGLGIAPATPAAPAPASAPQ